jgi:hypothetical protein
LLFVLDTGGTLWQDSSGSWAQLKSNVQSFALNPQNGLLFVLDTGGTLWQDSSGTWATLDTNVKSFVLGPHDGYLFVLEKTGSLRQDAAGTWTVLNPPGVAFVNIWLVNGGYTLDALDTNNKVWQFVA